MHVRQVLQLELATQCFISCITGIEINSYILLLLMYKLCRISFRVRLASNTNFWNFKSKLLNLSSLILTHIYFITITCFTFIFQWDFENVSRCLIFSRNSKMISIQACSALVLGSIVLVYSGNLEMSHTA